MSQDNTRRSDASFASDGSVSDFDPEHEAMASTREFDNSPRLPHTKTRARRQHNLAQDEPDYAINTSTLERAFPEFSHIQTSEEDEDDSNGDMSIEIGRGAGKPMRRLDDSRSSFMSLDNSVRSSSPAVRVDYPTPQKPAMRSTSRRAASESLRKDAQLRRASQAQKENMSPKMAKGPRDQRRTLSEMHAKVRDNYDGSFLGDERPAPISMNTRSTRFGNPSNSQDIVDAVERASREAYVREPRKTSASSTPRKATSNAMTASNAVGDTVTRQSFLLPDLPNISDLVSGVYEDGTPVYSRQQRTRSTRFVSPPQDATDVSLTGEHRPLDAVPIPEDEKALFVSLRLLQDKVAELEMAKSEAEKRLAAYRQENAALKGNRPRHSERYDAEEGDYRKPSKRPASEIQKLEAANLALQNQLDIADRKAQVQESALKRLNHERESAISQLGAAYLESRELKTENEDLRQEVAELQSQLGGFPGRKTREETTVGSERSSASDEADDSRIDAERSADLSRSTKDLASKSSRSNLKNKRQDDARAKVSTQVDKEIALLEKERAEEALFSLDMPTSKRSSGRGVKSNAARQAESKNSKKQPNTSKQRVKRVVVEDASGPVEVTEQSKASSDVEDLTLLSVIDTNEIARLRKTLEEERLSRKQRRLSAPTDFTTETVNSTRQGILKTPAPRKSSLRESKSAIPRPASATGDFTALSRLTSEEDGNLAVPLAERPRRHSDNSVPSTSGRRKRRNVEDMTSAFILPDITLHGVDLAARNPSRLPEAAQRALDGIAQHDGKNCVICKHSVPNDGVCSHETVKVPKPIPVSERMPKLSAYNEEPTLRPSQSPAVALATVLKTLEDELSHLKMQLATYQGAFNKLDASLGKRQRKSLTDKIEKLLKDIDMKSDQIYALYDVLEGQKQSGQEMTEREMEMTLESIGIDVAASHAPDVTGTTDKSSRHAGHLDEDEYEELPWEGIESTADITGRSTGSHP